MKSDGVNEKKRKLIKLLIIEENTLTEKPLLYPLKTIGLGDVIIVLMVETFCLRLS